MVCFSRVIVYTYGESFNKEGFVFLFFKANFFFFHKCKFYIVWNWFIAKYFNLTKIFYLRLFKIVINQTVLKA